MIETTTALLAGLAGIALGAAYFGSLWWSTRQALASSRSAPWLAGSLFVRLAIGAVGFYWVCQDRWERWLGCLAGFMLVRVLTTSMMRRHIHAATPARALEVRDAS